MRILGAALLPLILLVPSVGQAQKRATPAADAKKKVELLNGPVGKAVAPCGAKILPLVEGNQWTYTSKASEFPVREDLLKLTPNQPGTVVITVKSVQTDGGDTVATLEEKTTTDISIGKDAKKHVLDQRTITSTITCNPKKFEISPESFFFAGEPGGVFELAFDKLERSKDTSWKLTNGTIGDSPWREDIVAHFTRTAIANSEAKLDGGKLELERVFTPAQPERINTDIGLYTAERVALKTTGRVTLDHAQPDTQPLGIPDNWINQLWLVPNVGVVKVVNAYSHVYMLNAVQLK